jgi:hypothetical protein
MKSRRYIGALVVVSVMLCGTAFAATASAAPVWKFNATELSGNETIVGAAISSSLSIPGATTTCAHFLYNMKIFNNAGAGKGEITELPLFECKTSGSKCSVESIEAEKLPWPTHLVNIAGKGDYLVVEKVSVGIVYSGALCALAEEKVEVTGSAGGLIENATQTAKFNKATFEATGTSLLVASSSVEWNGLFPTEGFTTHREQTLEG